MSSKVDDACEKVIEYLNAHGKARWSDLTQLGVPKTTLYRALKKLLGSGVVRYEGRFYVLAEKDYVAIVPHYVRQICDVIECGDVESFTKDLMGVGANVRAVEKAYTNFISTYTKTIGELGIQKLLRDLFQSLYGHRGVFTVFLFEVAKIYKGLNIIRNCSTCEAFQLCPSIRSIVESFTNTIETQWGLKPEVFDNAEKVGAVIEKHGYDGKVRISLFGLTTLKISIPELILMSVASITPLINPNILKLYEKTIELGYSYYVSGCRPLGEREKENLIMICTQSSNKLIPPT